MVTVGLQIKKDMKVKDMAESTRMLLGLLLGIAVMIYLVSRTKVHTFIALMIAAVITGVIGGMPLTEIVVPLILILSSTILGLFGIEIQLISFLGEPIIALAIGTLLAIYGLMAKDKNKYVLDVLDDALKATGVIMLITGAGGSLDYVIRVSGVGDAIGEVVLHWAIPAVLIPFIIAALMRIALGSATVAITTAASLSAPLLGVLNVSPLLMAVSCCVGAISFSYFNDSGFWVWNGMYGVNDLKDQVRCKTAISLIMAAVGVVELLILSMFLH